MKDAGKIDPKAVENTSRRIGLESRLAEKVVSPKEDRNCHAKARNDRFEITGEPSAAPRHEDAQKEQYCRSRNSGGKAVHAGAFDKKEQIPAMLGKKK